MNNNQLITLAEQFGTPLYVYDSNLIKQRYQELKEFIPHPRLRLYYAMKANYNPHILTLLMREGAFIDAVSPAEVLLALNIGFQKEQIIFTANMMTDEEMQEVYQTGVLFNIGSLSELERFGKFFPGSEVCIRFNPEVVAGFHERVRTGGKDTKFGILLENLELVKEISKKYQLKIVGVHEHTGSGIPETVDMLSGLRNIINIINQENFPDLKFVDFGGGFQIPYQENELRKDYASFGKVVIELFDECCKQFGKELNLVFEPGRYLVAESGVLVVQVNTIKENSNHLIVGVNSGFPQLIRPMFYNAYHKIGNLSNPKGLIKKYDVAGNICESGDYFTVARELPEIRVEDFLVIKDAGAYCYSMGGIYNLRAMPMEIMVNGGEVKVISKKNSNKELVENIIIDSNYEI
ncbi:MAG: diaminopimelate decarboxylase [Candidatus Woesearchaeota archaeon]